MRRLFAQPLLSLLVASGCDSADPADVPSIAGEIDAAGRFNWTVQRGCEM